MEARLGVTTCDKCKMPMKEGEPILIIAEGNITESNDKLAFQGSCVRYGYYLNCRDGFEKFANK